jgi:hypothetical protein
MRSTGLTAADWAVITEYQDCFEPLRLAIERLEGRGKSGNFGAIYEVIPVFDYVLSASISTTHTYLRVTSTSTYALPEVRQTTTTMITGGIDVVIGAFIHRNNNEGVDEDEYERWKTQEPECSREQYLGDGRPIVYWIQMRST